MHRQDGFHVYQSGQPADWPHDELLEPGGIILHSISSFHLGCRAGQECVSKELERCLNHEMRPREQAQSVHNTRRYQTGAKAEACIKCMKCRTERGEGGREGGRGEGGEPGKEEREKKCWGMVLFPSGQAPSPSRWICPRGSS